MLEGGSMEKVCISCGKTKKIDDFYKHNQMRDGHLNKCIDCVVEYQRERRVKNLDKIRAYDRNRKNKKDRTDMQKLRKEQLKIQNPDLYAEKERDRTKKYRDKHKEKYRAHYLVAKYVLKGILVNPRLCQKCGSKGRVEAHHDDYSKPLDVLWLCPPCHALRHIEMRTGKKE
jgi:hypothetical protein